MSHLFKTGNSIFKVGDNVYKVNDRLNILVENKGGFGASMELLRVDPIIANQRVAVTSGGFVKIIDTSTFATIASINIGGPCVGVAWDNANSKLYVTSTNNLFAVNTTTWVATNTGLVNYAYNGIALDPNPTNNRLVIAGGTKLYFVDITTYSITTIMTTGFTSAYGLAFHPDLSNRLYVCNYNGNNISIVDTDNYVVVDTITGLNWPIDLSFDSNPANNRFLVSEYMGNSIAYINKATHGIIKRPLIVTRPDGISFDPNGLNDRYFIASAAIGQYVEVKEIIS